MIYDIVISIDMGKAIHYVGELLANVNANMREFTDDVPVLSLVSTLIVGTMRYEGAAMTRAERDAVTKIIDDEHRKALPGWYCGVELKEHEEDTT